MRWARGSAGRSRGTASAPRAARGASRHCKNGSGDAQRATLHPPPGRALRGIQKRFRDGDREQWVLDGLDLEVAQGEMVAVVGASGSGKSTLLHIVGGLDRDFAGEATVAGRALARMPERERAQYRNAEV